MKLLARIEKQKISWILILLCVIFSFLRLPSLIEPYWYGDEGIYEVIGQSMSQGHLLYQDIWDNKPPLLYVVYALANGDQTMVKTFSLIVGLLTIIAFYFLSQKLFNKQKISIILTIIFLLLFATPILEANIANAEDFILLPIIPAGIIIYKFTINNTVKSTKPLFIAGVLLGLAFLFKIVAVFDLAAFLFFVFIVSLPENHSRSLMKNLKVSPTTKRTLITVLLGFVIPFFIAIIYFTFNYSLINFFQAAFLGNVDYVGWKNDLLGIPQGWLVLKIVLLLGSITIILLNRKHLSKQATFIFLWLLFALFNAYFSGRPYTHYAIVLIPSMCLLIGLFFTTPSSKNKINVFAVALILIITLYNQFGFKIVESYRYYQNVLQFLNSQKNVEAYQTFFDPKVPRDYAVANFITTHTGPSDAVFVWGNNPEIYALSHKVPISKYTVAYHISQNNAFDETQRAINKKEPKYIIVLSESQPLPFVIPLYIMRYDISGATIYERNF